MQVADDDDDDDKPAAVKPAAPKVYPRNSQPQHLKPRFLILDHIA
jgi:hypothetical protein